MNELSFVVADNEGCVELVPVDDGTPLTQFVEDYESAHGMTPPGGYGKALRIPGRSNVSAMSRGERSLSFLASGSAPASNS